MNSLASAAQPMASVFRLGGKIWWAVPLALAFFALALVSILASRNGGEVAAVWLPNAFAVALLLRMRASLDVPLFFAASVGILFANLTVGDDLLRAASFVAANLLEIMLTVYLVRRLLSRSPIMEDIGDLIRFALLGGLVAPLISGAALALMFGQPAGASMTLWVQWALTDGLAMIMIAPAMMIFYDFVRNWRRPSRRQFAELALLLCVGAMVTTGVFLQSSYSLMFLIGPVMVAFAFRMGSFGAAVATVLVASIATSLTYSGKGPIIMIGIDEKSGALVLQSFLASAFAVGLPVAATLAGYARSRKELTERETQLSLLADNITDAVMRYDLDGVCTYVSPSVRDVLGIEPWVLLGQRASDRMHEDAKEAISGAEKRLLSGESDKERLTYRRMIDDADGNPVWIEAECALACNSATGRAEGIIVSARDVTERVELERQLKRARVHAENAAEAKSQFLANMSHEIRTPMNGVLGFAELLANGDLTEQQRRYAELIGQSGRSMMRLLNDILDISKIEAGQIEIQQEPTDLSDLLTECVNLHQALAQQKSIDLSLECSDDLGVPILTDPLRVRQIVLNLVGNAVKFTQQGSVRIAARMEAGKAIIAVTDTGIGIHADRIETVFRSFEQADHTVTRKFGGTGLGLTISRELAEMLGGQLDVSSQSGKGSCFTLQVPALSAPAQGPFEDVSEHPAEDSRTMPPCGRVLLAEDHDINRLLVTAMLEEFGQCVSIAHNGNEALRAVLTAEEKGEPFDIVLMDVQMPISDGYSATSAIRRAGFDAKRLPIIALTANAYPEDIAAARDAGMQDHLAKPLSKTALLNVLQRWLPVRIVAEPMPPTPAKLPSPENDNRNEGQAVDKLLHSPALVEKWHVRRSEALSAVTSALQSPGLADADKDELAALVHKLAGTAGMFGEVELGERASAFERALRSSVEPAVCEKLARELLEAA